MTTYSRCPKCRSKLDIAYIESEGAGGECPACGFVSAYEFERLRGSTNANTNGHKSTPELTSEPHRESEVGRTLPVTSLAHLRMRYKGEVEWIVPGYLARGEVVFLAGAGESLKSWIAAHLAASIDGRFKWLGSFAVDAERVLFLEQERASNFLYQLNRIETGEGVELGSDRLLIVPPIALPLSELDAQVNLRETVARHRPDVLIINALRDVLGRANENSPTDMAGLLRSLGRIAEDLSCCVLIIDHFNKAGLAGIVRGNVAHAGTSQKHNEADAVLIAERARDEMGKGIGPATVSTSKRRSGEPGGFFAVSVSDIPGGGVLVRAEEGVRTLSPTAQAVYLALATGPALVKDLEKRLGKSNDSIHQALSELRAAGKVEGAGEVGKPHSYRRTDGQEPTSEPLIDSEMGQASLSETDGALALGGSRRGGRGSGADAR